MHNQDRFTELRRILYKEIKGQLRYQEKKELVQECIDEKVLAKLSEKYLRRKRNLSIFIIFYGIFLVSLLIVLLLSSDNAVIAALITFAIVLVPFFISFFYNKSILGYEKIDLVLRLITKFYAKNK